jgi:hypothetical protein
VEVSNYGRMLEPESRLTYEQLHSACASHSR